MSDATEPTQDLTPELINAEDAETRWRHKIEERLALLENDVHVLTHEAVGGYPGHAHAKITNKS